MRSILLHVFVLSLLISSQSYGQFLRGFVLSSESEIGIGFVNIGIIGKNIGTVTDEKGNFTINPEKIQDDDSITFSMIGYESKTFSFVQFKNLPQKIIYLKPITYKIQEVKIYSRRSKEVMIGVEMTYSNFISGFAYNDLGAEMGINVLIKKPIRLKNLNINVAKCTYDSVTYRFKIYKYVGKEFKNILEKPVYFSFVNKNIRKVISYDLLDYSIIVEGNILFSLEIIKDLGKGDLLLYTDPTTDYTWQKKTSEGSWTKSPGSIGFYFYGDIDK